jgi:hypothetical protein
MKTSCLRLSRYALSLIVGLTEIAVAQTEIIQANADSCVQLIVIDPLGRRCGVDPFAEIKFKEIPEANYAMNSVGFVNDGSGSGRLDYFREFVTGGDYLPPNGTFKIRLSCIKSSSYRLWTNFSEHELAIERSGVISKGQVRYFRFVYSSNPSSPITLDSVFANRDVAGGLSNSNGSLLSIQAKSSVGFGLTDTIRYLTATIRWPSSSNISLGTVSSPIYGFQKWESPVTIGNYTYQKFRTTQPTALNWNPNSVHELFTVPVSGESGSEVFELTNELVGGEWFVDIGYQDRTDPNFYLIEASYTHYDADWSLISVPRNPLSLAKTSIFPRPPVDVLYGYDDPSYTEPEALTLGQSGYWALFSDSATISVTGWRVDSVSAFIEVPPEDGGKWILIGALTESVPVSHLTTSPPGAIRPGTLNGWDGQTQQYFYPETLEPGSGYWVLLGQSCTIYIKR